MSKNFLYDLPFSHNNNNSRVRYKSDIIQLGDVTVSDITF